MSRCLRASECFFQSGTIALIEQGANERAVWAELREWVEGARRLRETERKRMEALNQYITAEQAAAWDRKISADIADSLRTMDL